MKNLIIIACAILFVSCSVKKKQVAENDAEEVVESIVVEENIVIDDGLTKVAESFAKAVIDIDPNSIAEFNPNANLARMLSPTVTANKTDEEIEKEMLADLRKRLELNLERIQKAIEDNSVDRASFKYESYKYYETEEPATVPRVLEVNFLNGNKEVHVPITVLKHDGKWFIFEILNTTNLFK